MTDTPAHIHQAQLAIFNKLNDSERIGICLEMMEEGMRQLEANIQRQHPGWSQAELAVATFERMYRGEFTPEKLTAITNSIRAYHHKSEDN